MRRKHKSGRKSTYDYLLALRDMQLLCRLKTSGKTEVYQMGHKKRYHPEQAMLPNSLPPPKDQQPAVNRPRFLASSSIQFAQMSQLIGVGGGARLGEGWVAAKIDLSIAIGPTEETSARCLLHSGLTRVPQPGKAHDMNRDGMDDGITGDMGFVLV